MERRAPSWKFQTCCDPELVKMAELADAKVSIGQGGACLACFGGSTSRQLRIKNAVSAFARYHAAKMQVNSGQPAFSVASCFVTAVLVGLDTQSAENLPNDCRRVFLVPVRRNGFATGGANDEPSVLDAHLIAPAK